jgi:uncharacterized protein
LVIPAWHPVLERVYIYKTAHHPRLESDYKQPAIDAAMATAAAPTFLKPHITESAVMRGDTRHERFLSVLIQSWAGLE